MDILFCLWYKGEMIVDNVEAESMYSPKFDEVFT